MIRPAGFRKAEDDRRGLLPRGYLAAQSASIVVWWMMLAYAPATRETFAPAALGGMRWLVQFLPADVVTVIGGALAAGWWRRYAGRLGVVLCVIGISTQTLACRCERAVSRAGSARR